MAGLDGLCKSIWRYYSGLRCWSACQPLPSPSSSTAVGSAVASKKDTATGSSLESAKGILLAKGSLLTQLGSASWDEILLYYLLMMTTDLKRVGPRDLTEKRRPCGPGGRDSKEAAPGQGALGALQVGRGGKERSLRLRQHRDARFPSTGLLSWERIRFCHLEPPSSGLLEQPSGMNTRVHWFSITG